MDINQSIINSLKHKDMMPHSNLSSNQTDSNSSNILKNSSQKKTRAHHAPFPRTMLHQHNIPSQRQNYWPPYAFVYI